jgi:hypothetical protein
LYPKEYTTSRLADHYLHWEGSDFVRPYSESTMLRSAQSHLTESATFPHMGLPAEFGLAEKEGERPEEPELPELPESVLAPLKAPVSDWPIRKGRITPFDTLKEWDLSARSRLEGQKEALLNSQKGRTQSWGGAS